MPNILSKGRSRDKESESKSVCKDTFQIKTKFSL